MYVWKKMRAVTNCGKLFFKRWNEVTFCTREEQKKIVESDRNIKCRKQQKVRNSTQKKKPTTNFQITKSSDLWRLVKKCRWEKGNKKIKDFSKEWEI
jgi:hypothetical protein